MLRTAGQLASLSKNSPLTGHTRWKLPASPRGWFYPTISQQQRHQPEFWRGQGRVSDPTPQDTGVMTSFQLSGRVYQTLRRSINALEALISTCPSLLLTLIRRQAKVTPANILNRKPLKPLQHLVFIGPRVSPPCCILWLVRPKLQPWWQRCWMTWLVGGVEEKACYSGEGWDGGMRGPSRPQRNHSHSHASLLSRRFRQQRKPPQKQEWGKQSGFTVNSAADVTLVCIKIRPKKNSPIWIKPSGTTKQEFRGLKVIKPAYEVGSIAQK